jgi:alcohol dehydrogenase
VLHVPDELADEVACPANCATATVAAALRAAGECRDRAILIQGAGMLGLTAAAMARHRAAREVIVADPDAGRLERAKDFGATRLVHLQGDSKELADVVALATSGHGVDAAIELSGDPAAVEAGLPLLCIGGHYVQVGAVFPSRAVALPVETVVRRLLRIEGVHNYTPADLCTAVKFLAAAHARYPFAELVTARFPLAKAEAAFQHAAASRSPRVAVVPLA